MSPVDDASDTGDAITLMTLHSAKGLEFPLVFICGMEENLFPTSRAVDEEPENPQAIEEERRLFYVGITRAQQHLSLLWARQRYTFGSLVETAPSRFLDEIPRDLLALSIPETPSERSSSDREVSRPTRRTRKTRSRPAKKPAPEGVHYEWEESSTPHGVDEFAELVDQEDFLAKGRWVLHPTWGRGQIVEREGTGADLKLSIRFRNNQMKRVMVAYAQLEPA